METLNQVSLMKHYLETFFFRRTCRNRLVIKRKNEGQFRFSFISNRNPSAGTSVWRHRFRRFFFLFFSYLGRSGLVKLAKSRNLPRSTLHSFRLQCSSSITIQNCLVPSRRRQNSWRHVEVMREIQEWRRHTSLSFSLFFFPIFSCGSPSLFSRGKSAIFGFVRG